MGSKRKPHFRIRPGVRLRFLSLVALFSLFLQGPALHAQKPTDEVGHLLPHTIEGFRPLGTARPISVATDNVLNLAGTDKVTVAAKFAGVEADYLSPEGNKLMVQLVQFPRDSDAYSVLTILAKKQGADELDGVTIGRDLGTAGFVQPDRVAFFKGRTFVRISATGQSGKAAESLVTLAHLLANSLEKGEGDVPVLVKHLPQWEQAQQRLVYHAGFNSLKDAVPNQPVLEVVSSEGDADAAIAEYGGSNLVIVEFNTPQLAADNDRLIAAKIQDLRSLGQPLPSAYRRVGNYSVFVFNSPNEQIANGLIDQIQYEQVVHWLGDNPNLLEKAQRDYYQTTAGLLLAVVKASGYSALACLALGGLMGAILFNRRRMQQRDAKSFSDAGGMLRLNIDELTSKADRTKLIGPGS